MVGSNRSRPVNRPVASRSHTAGGAGSRVTVALIAGGLLRGSGGASLPGTCDTALPAHLAPHIMAPYMRPACSTREEGAGLTGAEQHAEMR